MNANLKRKVITLGKVIKPHGVRGGVKVKTFTEDLENFLDYDTFFLNCGSDDSELELSVSKTQPLNGFFVVYFEGINDLDQAEGLRGMDLQVTREMVVGKKNLSDDDVLVDDLIGFQVYEEEALVGYISDYYQGGVNGLYLVKFEGEAQSDEVVTDSPKFTKPNKPMKPARQHRVGEKDFFIPCDVGYYESIDWERGRIFLHSNSVVR